MPSDFESIQETLRKVINLLTPLTEEQRKFVVVSAAAWFGDSDKLVAQPQQNKTSAEAETPNLQDFVFSKKTKNDVEAVAVLGYYLTKYKGQELFRTSDLDSLNKEAATGQVFGNITKTVNNAAQRSAFFASVGEKGFKKITPLGRMIVEALPNEDEVKRIMKENKPRSRRKSTKKAKIENKEIL